MRWYSRSVSAPAMPRNCGPVTERKPTGREEESPVPQYLDQSTHGVNWYSTACWPPRQRAVGVVTLPWKRRSRVSGTLRKPPARCCTHAFSSAASSCLGPSFLSPGEPKVTCPLARPVSANTTATQRGIRKALFINRSSFVQLWWSQRLNLLLPQLLQNLDAAVWDGLAMADAHNLAVAEIGELANRSHILAHVQRQTCPAGFDTRPGHNHIADEQRFLLGPIKGETTGRVAGSGDNCQRSDMLGFFQRLVHEAGLVAVEADGEPKLQLVGSQRRLGPD